VRHGALLHRVFAPKKVKTGLKPLKLNNFSYSPFLASTLLLEMSNLATFKTIGGIILDQSLELQYALDTFYFLVCGALVMWMAAGFAMLEAGLVRSKNTAEILTKNMALFAISCIMYLVCGYAIMYGGGIFLSGIELDGAASAEALTETVLAESREEGFGGGAVYRNVYRLWCGC
jgi:hypothetical protein